MQYGITGSGAYDFNIPAALSDYFRYDSDATLDDRDINRMVEEIQWQRPVLLCGDNDTAGHCWVVYGYNQATSPWQFAMNMGWGGADDGWYSVDKIPKGLNDDQTHVTHIAPQGVTRFVGGGNSGDGSPSSPYSGLEEAMIKAADHATLILKANSINSFAGSQLRVARPLTLKGINATIRK
jgi:hypothetical protein